MPLQVCCYLKLIYNKQDRDEVGIRFRPGKDASRSHYTCIRDKIPYVLSKIRMQEDTIIRVFKIRGDAF